MVAWYESFPTKELYRAALKKLETEMLALPQSEMDISHSFIDGIYARAMRVKAGTLVVGGLHAGTSMNIMSEGDMTVMTEDGVKRVSAPYNEISHAGTKRIAIAHADSTWTNIIRTDLTDVSDIEKMFTADDYPSIEIKGE